MVENCQLGRVSLTNKVVLKEFLMCPISVSVLGILVPVLTPVLLAPFQ